MPKRDAEDKAALRLESALRHTTVWWSVVGASAVSSSALCATCGATKTPRSGVTIGAFQSRSFNRRTVPRFPYMGAALTQAVIPQRICTWFQGARTDSAPTACD
jgi:hypothetical protein